MTNIYIADDHAMLRDGLKSIINEVDNMMVVGETNNSKNIIKDIRTLDVDIILLDISMPGPGFLEILSRLTDSNEDRQEIKILVLSTHPEEQYAIRAIKAGANGYLTKDHSPSELINAIQHIMKGKRYISQALAELMANDVVQGSQSKSPHENLSNREYQILCMLGKGMPIKEISHSLSLSPKTVSTYRIRLCNKLNFKNNADLIHYVIDHNLSKT
jgi:two-component system, NarL family, invasion response regulator UvrY